MGHQGETETLYIWDSKTEWLTPLFSLQVNFKQEEDTVCKQNEIHSCKSYQSTLLAWTQVR